MWYDRDTNNYKDEKFSYGYNLQGGPEITAQTQPLVNSWNQSFTLFCEMLIIQSINEIGSCQESNQIFSWPSGVKFVYTCIFQIVCLDTLSTDNSCYQCHLNLSAGG